MRSNDGSLAWNRDCSWVITQVACGEGGCSSAITLHHECRDLFLPHHHTIIIMSGGGGGVDKWRKEAFPGMMALSNQKTVLIKEDYWILSPEINQIAAFFLRTR
jgi:hypothetical protein